MTVEERLEKLINDLRAHREELKEMRMRLDKIVIRRQIAGIPQQGGDA